MPLLNLNTPSSLSLNESSTIHFIGAGGIGMSGLAKICCEKGLTVTGSDKRDNDQTQRLRQLGATIHTGHQAGNLTENAIVVASTAISPTNPEIAIATERQQPVIHRSQLLKIILEDPTFNHSTTIGISGSHGKTSTTGMVMAALSGGGLTPTGIAGGLFPEILASPLTNAITGNTFAVAELDESDGSLISYTPTISVLLNLEMDHAEHFPGGLAELTENIRNFITGLGKDNTPRLLVANTACPNLAPLLDDLPANVTLLGFDWWNNSTDTNSYRLTGVHQHKAGCYAGELLSSSGEMLTSITMSAPGKHQLGNGAIAMLIAHQLNQTTDTINIANAAEKLSAFTGMGRRFEQVGSHHGVKLIDDYAHHPTEITATLAITKAMAESNAGKVIAVFEPHRYSRLKQFWTDFQHSLADADVIVVTDVYEASEAPIEEINAENFITELSQRYPNKAIQHLPRLQWDNFLSRLDNVTDNDIIISLGAGDVTHLLRQKSDETINQQQAVTAS
jgi:UDP-N-acetylmuramate--alanine ligase